METVGQRRLWEAVLAMALFLGVLHSASCVQFQVKDSKNKTCILADLFVNFTVEYNTSASKQEIAKFELPAASSVGPKSTCGDEKEAALLVIVFGLHSLSINFTKSVAEYQVDELVFAYNLSDAVLFPKASENGTKEVTSKNSAIAAKTNTAYRCLNPHLLRLGNVNLTFHDVKLEAYLSNGNYSKNESLCREDISPTSSPTHSPTPSPTTVPVNPKPEVGEYRVNDSSSKACLLAKMGLHLNFTYSKKDGKVAFYELNIDPKNISVAGLCANTSSTLILYTDQVYLLFNFALNTTLSKFYLARVHVNATLPEDPKFDQDNSSLLYLQTTAHKSYKCIAKETLQITGNFSIDTYSLQIQPFNVDGNKFGPALDCAADQNGMLVPIVVGAALAGLVLIVLIAYLIGRKRSHAGYQTI